jgi:hypothetical protein
MRGAEGASVAMTLTFALDRASVRLAGRVTAEHDSNDRDRHHVATDGHADTIAAQRRPATDVDGSHGILVLMVQVRILAAEQQVKPL